MTTDPVDNVSLRAIEAAKKAEALEATWLQINTRGRRLVQIQVCQDRLEGEPIVVTGVLTRVNPRGIFVNSRRFGVRQFRPTGEEVGNGSGIRSGLKIVDLSQITAELPPEA